MIEQKETNILIIRNPKLSGESSTFLDRCPANWTIRKSASYAPKLLRYGSFTTAARLCHASLRSLAAPCILFANHIS